MSSIMADRDAEAGERGGSGFKTVILKLPLAREKTARVPA